MKITLTENQIVYVPQGWYHEVASFGDENIIALNIWFNSIEDLCNGREKYLLKYLISNQIESELKELIPNYKKTIQDDCQKLLKMMEVRNKKAEFMIKLFVKQDETGRNLLIASLFEIPKNRVRSFILDLVNYNPGIFEKMLLGLSYMGVECFTRILEETDYNFPTSFESDSEGFINIDEFYTRLTQKVDYKTITEYFMDCKKCLKEIVLKNNLVNKLCSSYKF